MTAADPTETRTLFEHDRVAKGYASARPYLHPEVLARLAAIVRFERRPKRALDVGCGTGMSSRALLGLAGEVVGTDTSLPMLRHAQRTPRIRYAAAAAEALPFKSGAFDLVVACGSIDWVDRSCFLPRAADLLAAGGWLVALDFGDAGRSPEVAGLERWYRDAFERRYPRPPASDPVIGAAEAARAGFEAPSWSDFASSWAFTARQYAEFLTTESNVIAAIEYGDVAPSEVRVWLESELRPLFGEGPRRVAFSGYIQALRKP